MGRALTIAAVLAVGVCAPRPAKACGGFFCSSAPVDQSGERVVYSLEPDGTITMSVEIAFVGEDDQFAWILPVIAPPTEIGIGSTALFDQLGAATQATFVSDDRVDGACRPEPTCTTSGGTAGYDSGGCGGGDGWSGGYVDAASIYLDASARTDASFRPDAGVIVFSTGVVGPYETVVLGAATSSEVVDWLIEHGYDVPPESAELLAPYAAAGQVFVALRLSANTPVGVLRPISLRIPSSEACLPIRLTAIASASLLPITAYFLASDPVVPTNYATAVVDLRDVRFWTGGRSWREAVGDEADRLGGRAFAVEYSGATPAVELALPSVADLATESEPARFVMELQRRGYPSDALLLELLEQHLVPPPEWASRSTDYYNCLASTGACDAPLSYDPAALAGAIELEIAGPRRDAEAIVHRHGHLTRLYTDLSPAEMTVDPVFAMDARAPEVSNVHTATLVTECSSRYYASVAPQHWEIEGAEIPARRAGTLANDDDYCAARGGTPYRPAAPSTARDGCGCGASEAGGVPGVVVLAVIVALMLRRRR